MKSRFWSSNAREEAEIGISDVRSRAALKTDRSVKYDNTPVILRKTFILPNKLAVRYEKPALSLDEYITDYHILSSPRGASPQVDRFLPGIANVRIVLDAEPFHVEIGGEVFGAVSAFSLFGPTSHTIDATNNGGTVIGFGITPLGWSRLFKRRAGAYHNRIVPLSTAMSVAFTQGLRDALSGCRNVKAVAPALNDFLREELGPQHPDEPLIRHLMALLNDGRCPDIVTAAAELGIATHALWRLSVRHFGLPPKMLLRRARFLRAFLRICGSTDTADYTLLDDSYFDVPHFLRDAKAFLGMTPRHFLSLGTPLYFELLRARLEMIGSSTQALHDITAPSHPTFAD